MRRKCHAGFGEICVAVPEKFSLNLENHEEILKKSEDF